MGGWETMETAASTARNDGRIGFANYRESGKVPAMFDHRRLIPFFLALSHPAAAVVVASGGPNNTAPGGQPFFSNVGSLGSASAVYLSDGWVMTANHVASSLPASVSFGGIPYTTVPGSFQRLGNDAPLTTFTDIVLFRLNAPPPLPAVSLSAATPTVGSQVMMVGNGRIQNSETYWNRTVIAGDGNDTWVETTEPLSNISGFQTTTSHELRWGENVVNDDNFVVNIGQGDVVSFSTQFDNTGLTQEAQAVSGDSGGAVFSFNGSSWELSGMMYAVSEYETQPGGADSAVFGVQTAIADLSYYRGRILNIIPEPSCLMFSLIGAAGIFRRRR